MHHLSRKRQDRRPRRSSSTGPTISTHGTSEAPSIEDLMARMVAGDPSAIFELHAHHGNRVRAVVWRQLRRLGLHAVDPAEVDALVLDACVELQHVAPSWRPGGALPWWWAEGRIRAIVNGWMGVRADALEVHAERAVDEAVPATTEDEAVQETFRRLVAEVPVVGLVAEAARRSGLDDDRLWCLLDYTIQQDQGDPSPAHTLAPRYGVSPDALRQRVSRSRRRLRAVVEDDPRFSPLAGGSFVCCA